MINDYSLCSRNRPQEQLNTLGDHLRRRRLSLKLLQRQVAEQIGVDKSSIYNWETKRTEPGLQHMPAIIRPPSGGWPERLVQHRTALGLSQKEAADRMGVDPCTLARWERGEREPSGAFAARASRFLDGTKPRNLWAARSA